MEMKDVLKVNYVGLGKLVTSYEGIQKTLKAFETTFGHIKGFKKKEFLVNTQVVTYFMHDGKKIRTIGRDLIV